MLSSSESEEQPNHFKDNSEWLEIHYIPELLLMADISFCETYGGLSVKALIILCSQYDVNFAEKRQYLQSSIKIR